MSRALEGLRKYQEAPRQPPPEPMPVVAERRGSILRDFGGTGAPVLFVPSLINPPSILDLSHGRSLLRWLAARGHHVLLLDWGWDLTERRDMSITDHVTDIAVPLIEELGDPPALVGYCLGGRLAFMTSARTDVDAAVGYYAVALDSILDEAEAIQRPLLLHIAGDDGFVPEETQLKMHNALDPHPRVALHDYPGEDHGFATEMGKRRSEKSAQLADQRTADFFERNLG